VSATRGVAMPRSSRDPDSLRVALTRWLTTKVGDTSEPQVEDMSSTDTNGMSSDTVMFTASWLVDGQRRPQQMVARIAPSESDLPVFPTYDLQMQYDVINLVHDDTDVPVPRTWWIEPDDAAIGSPFFVMSQVNGRVPPDNLPYTFGDNWLFDASPAEQQRLQASTVAAIAQLHAIPSPDQRLPVLHRPDPGDTPLRRHVAHTRGWWDSVAAKGMVSPIVERGFTWLEEQWPDSESPPVLLWGDARIGNVIYDAFEPAALLDWEMAGIGPCELDVAWLICAHLVFQDLATGLGLPGMPSFLRQADVVDAYEKARHVQLDDLHWHLAYCALQWAIVFLRTAQRAAHFTGQELPDEHDELIYCRSTLSGLLTG
jgi:aminoglycoside phosphotransferase (APT) family kinase protein